MSFETPEQLRLFDSSTGESEKEEIKSSTAELSVFGPFSSRTICWSISLSWRFSINLSVAGEVGHTFVDYHVEIVLWTTTSDGQQTFQALRGQHENFISTVGLVSTLGGTEIVGSDYLGSLKGPVRDSVQNQILKTGTEAKETFSLLEKAFLDYVSGAHVRYRASPASPPQDGYNSNSLTSSMFKRANLAIPAPILSVPGYYITF